MTQKEQMLRFIRNYDIIAEVALQNRFGSSFKATLQELNNDDFTKLNTEIIDSENCMKIRRIDIPDTWHITPKGDVWLKDMETERRLKQRTERWTWGLAVAAVIISLIALFK